MTGEERFTMFGSALDTVHRLRKTSQTRAKRRTDPNWHRRFVGGRWDLLGPLQLDFLCAQGLQRDHFLLDVGCGSLRAGIHFAGYLESGHYFGLDVNQALLDAGRSELAAAGLSHRQVNLRQDGDFRFREFGRQFDMAIAQSVFTHLPLNRIMRCLGEVEGVLAPGGRFYATFFENTGSRLNTDPINQTERARTFPDRDPFYYDPDVFRWAVEGSLLRFEYIGDWGHPSKQMMAVFTRQQT